MRTQQQNSLLILAVIFVLMFFLVWVTHRPVKIVTIRVPVEVPAPVQAPASAPAPVPAPVFDQNRPDTRHAPEFRGPPLKMYKPGVTQQVGILTDPLTNETLPLFAKEVNGRRDQYNYYTSLSNGNFMYSVPITYNSRECMDSYVGCQELYGNERVSVLGRDNEFETKIYRTENFF